MSALTFSGRPDLVRQSLALGLFHIDATTGDALSAPLRAVIERVGTRVTDLLMLVKPTGSALRYDPRLRAVLNGPPGGVLPMRVLVTPQARLGLAAVPDRSVIPRRVLVSVRLDADGLPRASGPAPEGSWTFRLGLQTGPTFPRAAGVTAIASRVLRAGRAVPWAHVEGRLGGANGTLIGTARTDDRGEFLLRVRGRPGQTPDALKAISVRLRLFAPAAPAPSAPRPKPYEDVPIEVLGSPDLAIDTPPPGYLPTLGPLVVVLPGRIALVTDIILP